MRKVLNNLCKTMQLRSMNMLWGMLIFSVLADRLLLAATHEIQQKYLNSHAHCGHTDEKVIWYTVTQEVAFNVLDDISPDTRTTAFRDCEMTFRSIRMDGRLCITQRKLKFDTNDIKLELYDGFISDESTQKPNKTINSDHGLMFLEWCTTKRFLIIKMAKSGPKPSVKDVHVDLHVYDLQSMQRKVPMDTVPSCGSTFILDQSRVNVTNIDPSMVAANIYPNCRINFEYVGQEENRTVCLVFESFDPTCSKANYTLTIFQTILNPETGKLELVVAGNRSCDKPAPKNWCSNSTKISLDLQRKVSEVVNSEKDMVFSVLVLDHNGDASTIPTMFLAMDDTASAGHKYLIMIILPIILAALFVLLIAVVIYWRLSRWYKLRSKVEGKRPEAEGREEERMLDNGHPKSGQNGASSASTGSAQGAVSV